MLFKETLEYFRNIVEDHKEIEGFCHGGIAKLRADVLSKQNYPLLWLETPSIDLRYTGSAMLGASTAAFVIILPSNDKNEDEAEVEEKWERCAGYCLDVISRLRQDANSGQHNVRLDIMDMDPIEPLLVDNCLGWRVEFKLQSPVNICYQAEKWKT